jgi:hypothetical protein
MDVPQDPSTAGRTSGDRRSGGIRWSRWGLGLGIALLAVVLVRCALPGDTLDDGEGITGIYVVNGVDPSGVEYSGTVTIGRSSEGGYDIEWIVTGSIQTGTGTLVGDRFDVVWRTITSPRGDSAGTATYTVGADGVLRGTRTVDGVADSGTEEIFPET